jgi:hypothetical protein
MSDMKKTTKELTEFQLKVKALLDEADLDVINCLFQSEVNNQCEIHSYYSGAEEFNYKVSGTIMKIEHQDNYGGEGQGEEYWSVYKFTDGTNETYVKFDGWYQSYNGSEFSEWFFVNPVVKQVTFYE